MTTTEPTTTDPTNTENHHPGSPEGLAELTRGRHPGTASIVRYFADKTAVIRLERTNSGPVFTQGDLVTERGTRYPLSLSHEDWEALETALVVHEAMSDLGAPVPDLRAIEATWLRLCPVCDAGLPAECACPDGDAREVIRQLVAEVRRAYDTARDGYHTLCQRFVDQPWKTRQEIAEVRDHHQLLADAFAKVEAERDAMRPVVEAARAYREARFTAQAGAAGDALVAAVDAGVLTAVGGETRHDWRVLAAYDDVGRVVDKHYEWTDITADHARELIADIRALGRSIDRVMRRTPAGPWREVTDDPA